MGLELGRAIGEHIGNFPRRVEALVRVFGVQFRYDVAHPLRRLGDDLADWAWRVIGQSFQNCQCGIGTERRTTTDHLVKHAAETEKVGTLVELLPQRLLGGHVHRRTCNRAALRHAGIIDRAGEPEVGYGRGRRSLEL